MWCDKAGFLRCGRWDISCMMRGVGCGNCVLGKER